MAKHMNGATHGPIVVEHEGIAVVRDDLFEGGTKARFIPPLFDGVDEVVYATPAQGGAQFALASVARALGKQATLFVAKRRVRHARADQAAAMGAKIVEVPNGYLNVVQARARAYCEETGARLAPFGMDTDYAVHAIAEAAVLTQQVPQEVWCACGSGTLLRGLMRAWPRARHHGVIVGGRSFDIEGATFHAYPRPFENQAPQPPFPSDPHYDAKAWLFCKALANPKARVLFWNVTGPATP